MPSNLHYSSRRLAPLPVAVLFPLVALAAGGCRGPNSPAEMQNLSYSLPPTDGPVVIHVRSDAFDDRREISEEYSAYHQGIAPPVGWSGVPESARSVVLMVEDPDASKPKPFVHWLVYDVPSAVVDGLPQGVAPGPTVEGITLARQGQNSSGSVGYFGPKPPKNDPDHHYHFQVFALNTFLNLPAGATRAQLLRAMNGHVVGKGELVGTYRER